jgi:uncharacterized tellurite resistance protein B-like protein
MMSFLDNLVSRAVSPHEAAVTCAVALLTLSGEFTELERRIISLFRDQFPPLSKVPETTFTQVVERAIELVHHRGAAQDVHQFVAEYVAPTIIDPEERLAAYRYAYSLAMVNLNIDEGEQLLLTEMKTVFGLSDEAVQAAEEGSQQEFAPLHRALAAVVLGFIVVTADGQVFQEELEEMRKARTLLEPIANLEDVQFMLVYDLGLSIYNRFLMDVDNRMAFLYNIVIEKLPTRDNRVQAFHYAASIATADGDLAKAEVDTLKDLLHALHLNDSVGESIFNQYMSRVKTIDGHPLVNNDV